MTRLDGDMEEPADHVVQGCTRCVDLVDHRSQIVNGQGADDTELLLIGEAPGEAEDIAGVPFVGRSGEVLNQSLEARGLDRGVVRITNCVRCRPPDNRNPRVSELTNCRPHLENEIAFVDPRVILALGRVPAEELLQRDIRVTDEVGAVEHVELGGHERVIVIGLHPAATLYNRNSMGAFEEALDRSIELAGLAHRNS